MARIYPFRGIRYNREKVADVSAVITEPYDKINDELQEKYYARHPYNIVRLIKGKTTDGDTPTDNQYTRARDTFRQWRDEGVLSRDTDEALYVYDEEYATPAGERKTRHGFIALGRLEEFGKGGVMPHEKTLSGPKADRLNLMRATGTQFGLIFMLYPDPDNEVNSALSEVRAQPADIEATDDNGVAHRIRVVTDRTILEKVARLMEHKQLFIADGHHRYETALNYRREMKEKGISCLPGNENYDNRMMAFVSMNDRGLTILPTHRLLFNLTAEQLSSFPENLAGFCRLEECANLDELLEKMARGGKNRFGLYHGGKFTLLVVEDAAKITALAPREASEEWKRLDVTVLHTLLEHLLGIDKQKLEEQTNVAYERYAETAVRLVDQGRYQAAILLNPTKASQVAAVAGNGERMPQKSTDFYPKLYTGLVINKLNLE